MREEMVYVNISIDSSVFIVLYSACLLFIKNRVTRSCRTTDIDTF
jgi:hypothetical protein